MGNENKVDKGDIEKEMAKLRSSFLPEVSKQKAERALTYSLEEEFAKTKKNKNPWVFIWLGVFIVPLVVGTIVFSMVYEKMSRQTGVAISEYEDLNLGKLFDDARSLERQLRRAERELRAIDTQYKKDRKAIREDNKDQKEGRLIELKQQYGRERSAKLREINDLKRKIAEYNKKAGSKVRRVEDMLNNSQDLATIKLKIQREKYAAKIAAQRRHYERQIAQLKTKHRREIDALTLKYNPKFSEGALARIINHQGTATYTELPDLGDFKPILSQEGITSKDKLKIVQRWIKNRDRLVKRIIEIPYINSMPKALTRLRTMDNAIVTNYERLWQQTATLLQKRAEMLSKYISAFDHYMKVTPENGYVIDAADTGKIYIHYNKVLPVKEGTVGFVFREDNVFIAKVEFYRTANGLRAKQLDVREGQSVQPFDKILIEVNK